MADAARVVFLIDRVIETCELLVDELKRERRAIHQVGREIVVPPPPPSRNPEDFVDLAVAARRFGMATDTLRLLVRTRPDLGRKAGGRWQVSLAALSSERGKKL